MTPLIQVVAQRHDADCGVAALAMFVGVSYEEALLALGGEAPCVLKSGVMWSHLKRAAATLGTRTVLRRRWSPDTDDGLLQVQYPKGSWHVVVLRRGLVFDTDQRVWVFEDFKNTPPRAPFGSLLVREAE